MSQEITIPAEISSDGSDYGILIRAAKSIKGVSGLTCEIGVCRGGGSACIMSSCIENNDRRTHIGIDPYGNIQVECGTDPSKEPPENELGLHKFDYTNKMRDKTLFSIFVMCYKHNWDFVFFNMEDVEFYNRFADGVPIYNEQKYLINAYSLVFFDGCHSERKHMEGIKFFESRTTKSGIWVFDNVGTFGFENVERRILEMGFTKLETNGIKTSYRK